MKTSVLLFIMAIMAISLVLVTIWVSELMYLRGILSASLVWVIIMIIDKESR